MRTSPCLSSGIPCVQRQSFIVETSHSTHWEVASAGKAFRRGVTNVAGPAKRSPSVEPKTAEGAKTCAVPHPETKEKHRSGQ